MTVHDVARRAGADLRAEVGEDLDRDLGAGLVAVRTAHRRRRQRVGALSVVAAAALVGGVAVLGPLRGTSTLEPTAPVPSSTWTQPPSVRPSCSATGFVTCLGLGDVVVTTHGTSYLAHLPDGFAPQPVINFDGATVDLLQDHGQAGVTFLDDPQPVGEASPSADAHALATWISSRSFLETSDAIRTRVGGRTAWRVNARLRDEDADPGGCNSSQPRCAALLEVGSPTWQTGVWKGMASTYYVLDGPGGHPVAVWVWAFDTSNAALRLNDGVVRSLHIRAANR